MTGAATFLAGPAALARAATSSTPTHLLRASYAPLAGEQFRVGSRLLRLAAVGDLAGAAHDESLRDHPEAFALSFSGPADGVEPAVQTFSHPAIGTFSLLVAPVGPAEGGVQSYEVVVDRSVGRPEDPPAPPKDMPAVPERPGSEEAAAKELAKFEEQFVRETRKADKRAAKRRRIKRRRLKRRRAARRRKVVRSRHIAVRRGRATVIR